MTASAAQLLSAGKCSEALAQLTAEVKAKPADPKLRVFLFQMLCVTGQWDRALTQLNVVADMDATAIVMKQMYGEAVRCEQLRSAVFAGQKAPMVFGYPEQWMALMIEALLNPGSAVALREQAMELAPTTSGTINDEPFEWIADGDSRIGPALEAIINHRYYWVPFQHLTQIDIEAPEDLRDAVWMPAHLQFSNGGDVLAMIPTRYSGSESASDELVQLARKTVWNEAQPGCFHGLGQRMLTTDANEYALMDVRCIKLNPVPTADEAGEAA
jgi:type VI secretion system protein ImpE